MPSTKKLFSIYGIPILGFGMLLTGLWHTQSAAPTQARCGEITMLASPDPRQNKSMALFLSQEAKNVAGCRNHHQPAALAHTIADYNLIAQECTPAVFQATNLPAAM